MNETSPLPQHRRWLDLRVPPLAVVAVLGGLAWVAREVSPLLTFSSSVRFAIAGVLACAGVVISVLGVVSFRRAGTTVNPLMPQSSTTLVVRGVYRFTRNPMYLGFLALLAAWVAWLGDALALVVLPAFVVYMNRFQIGPEEAALRRVFGNQFIAYRQRVRRWL